MELVYPIYLDIPMMSAFLASLENGLLEEASVVTKGSDKMESSKKLEAGAKVGGIFSGLLGVNLSGGGEKTISDSQELRIAGRLSYPNAALFIRLRELLGDNKLLMNISSRDDFEKASIGDLVEFEGLAMPNPGYQISRAFGQLIPLIEPINNVQIAELEQQIVAMKSMKVGPNEQFKTRTELDHTRDFAKAQQELKRKETDLYKSMGNVITPLFTKDSTETMLLRSEHFSLICHLYPEFARNGRVHDLYDANWRCIGKVIAKIAPESEFDLLKGSPISYVAQGQMQDLTKAMNNEALKIDIPKPLVTGPAIIVATLALFV